MITSSKEITANVSHEIRTPLARIRVVEDLIRKKFARGDFSGYERHLDNIREDIQILDDLVGRLLEFIKLDNYESTPKYEQFNPSELMYDLLVRFEPVIEFKELSIKKDILFSSPYTGDRSALTSVFLNILDNAFKFTPMHGNITIKMRSEQDFFETSIINSFRHLDQKDLDNIFKPFERAFQSDNAGSGLGLAIAKKIVDNHGGNIIALSSTEGFEIQVRLPLR
jgi:two-component system sensor histidine kinase CpxA